MNGYGQCDNFCEKLPDQLSATDVGIRIINAQLCYLWFYPYYDSWSWLILAQGTGK